MNTTTSVLLCMTATSLVLAFAHLSSVPTELPTAPLQSSSSSSSSSSPSPPSVAPTVIPSSAPPVEVLWGMCKVQKGVLYNEGRLINTKAAETTEICLGLCINDSGCSYASHEVSIRRCLIYANVKKEKADDNAVSFDCISGCAGLSEGTAATMPNNCTIQENIWHEGGGPKGGYHSQIHDRPFNVTAACSSVAASPQQCAQRCADLPRCQVYNWRAADNACHRFVLKGGRHWGKDAAGHHSGECH